jgi:hypothetical protein
MEAGGSFEMRFATFLLDYMGIIFQIIISEHLLFTRKFMDSKPPVLQTLKHAQDYPGYILTKCQMLLKQATYCGYSL